MASRPLHFIHARIRISPSRLALAVAALASVLAVDAHADGLYGGVDLGHPDYANSVNGIGGRDGSNGGIGAKVYGGYSLTPNFALEGSVFRLGHSRTNDQSVNTRGVAIDGVASYAFAPQWSVLGRLGVAEARFNSSFGDDSSSAVKAGAGVQYDWTKQVAFRLQYERYHFFNAFEAKPNVGEYSAGVKIAF